MFILKIVSLGWLLRQIVIHEIRRLSELPISYPPSLFPFAYLTPCCISSSLVCVHVCMWVHVCCWQGWFFSYSMSKLSFTLSWLSGFLLWPISRPFLPACLPSSGWSSSLGFFFFVRENILHVHFIPECWRAYLSNWQMGWLLVATWHGERHLKVCICSCGPSRDSL